MNTLFFPTAKARETAVHPCNLPTSFKPPQTREAISEAYVGTVLEPFVC